MGTQYAFFDQGSIPEGIAPVAEEAFGVDNYCFPGEFNYYARDEGQVVGFATASIEAPDPRVVPILGLSGPQGHLGQCGVLKSHQGRGIASAFYRLRLEALSAQTHHVFMSAWKRCDNGLVGPAYLARKFGFRVMGEIPDFWLEASASPDYACACCGVGDCHCIAVIYRKDF